MCEIQCLIFELYTNMVGGGQISHNSSIKRFLVQVSSCIITWKGCTLKFLTYFFALVHAMPYYTRPGNLVLSANRFLHFRRYSEACLGRMERVVCQVYSYFRFYCVDFYHYILAFANYLPTHYIARPTTKCHSAGDCL